MTVTLQPLKKKLQRSFTNFTNAANDVLDILENDKSSDAIAGELEKILPDLVEIVMRLKTSTSRSVARGRELASLPDLADGLADAVLSIDNLEMVQRLNYVELAGLLHIIHPDLLTAVFNELATYENGWTAIEAVSKAAQEKLRLRQ